MGAQTRRHHQLKNEFESDIEQLADRRVNPSLYAVQGLRNRWIADTHGTFDDLSVLDRIQRVKTNMPQHLIDVKETPAGYVVVLVTNFMYRVHKEMKSAGEVVFADTTSHVDKTNTSLTILVCSSVAGGLPLGVIISSTQTRQDYVTGIHILKNNHSSHVYLYYR